MEQIIFRPSLFKFETCKEFSEAFDLKKGDLILTNQYIYDPYFGKLGLEVETIFQEQYGAGEPTDRKIRKKHGQTDNRSRCSAV